MNIGKNSRGEEVKTVQEILTKLLYKPGPIDGKYGDKTERGVIRFQEESNLYADGIVGPNTWQALKQALLIHVEEQFTPLVDNENHAEIMNWVRVPADPYRDGYDRFFLREDVAEAYLRVYKKVKEAGGLITSSGARRSLNASAGVSRSATSFHYTGRALDLFVGSAMENRARDPFVVAAEGERYWRVYARADGGDLMEIEAVTYGSRKKGKLVSGRFIDLTSIFKEEGFERIRARSSFLQEALGLVLSGGTFNLKKGLKKGYQLLAMSFVKCIRRINFV